MLHSNVLSWLPPSAPAELLDPEFVLSAVEPEAGAEEAAAAIDQTWILAAETQKSFWTRLKTSAYEAPTG